MAKNLLVLGSASDIGSVIAHRFAVDGFDIILAARSVDRLSPDRSDIQISHGVKAYLTEFDAADFASHAAFYSGLPARPDVVLYTVGFLGEQTVAEIDRHQAERSIVANYSGAVSILSIAANDLEKRMSGSIIGISSVAGDRGRKSNYIYGSAKAGFSAFLAGLRHRLASSGVHVLTVKPGFVATKMTEGMDLPSRLTTSPKKLADAVFRAYIKQKTTLYYLPIWRLIMLIIRNVPEGIFVKTKL
jgi:short-subunit dehydrogenase